MLASLELKHKTSDLARLYRLLEERIDQYLTLQDDCFHEPALAQDCHDVKASRSVQKTIFRAMREREMKALRTKISEKNQTIHQAYSFIGNTPSDAILFENLIAENFLSTYQLIWDYTRRVNYLDEYKEQKHTCEGQFAFCLVELLNLMENELINNRNARLGNYFITERYLGIISHHHQDLRAAITA